MDRDIYKAADSESKNRVDPVVVDVPPAEWRTRSRRKTVGFLLLMAVILVVAWGVGHMLEQQDEGGGDPDGPPTAHPVLQETPGGALLATPDITDLTDAFMEPGEGLQETLDREKIATAMAKVRIAAEYVQAREWDGAELNAREALEIWPDMNAALRLLGFVYTQRGQFDQALVLFERALSVNPFSAEAFNNMATVYLQKMELEKAEEMLTTALNIRPNFLPSLINLGMLYIIMGRYEDTVDYLTRAVDIAPDTISARNNLAVALIRVGRYDEARRHLRYIIERRPNRATVYFNMAITYVYERDVAESMRYLELGAQRCSPMECLNYLNDGDFDPLRPLPVFRHFMQNLYPDLPDLPPES